MRLLIKQRVFSWTDTYDVYEENGNAKYFVRASFFTFGHQIHVYDRNDREVGGIYQKLLTFLPAFEVEIGGQRVGTIQKRLTLFSPKYEVNYNGWQVEGDFLGWDYEVFSGGRTVAHIHRELLHWGDTYVIDFENPRDEILCLLLVIAIDAANCTNGD